ncbi:hypothetical protein [Empedobacter tilapiae]|uniref:Uncharacterized protein n=1 Tax=Empedobacter tilapiae TaxID=2491114 RepID=A0A4Z1BQA5_9FLAO|nr:hypothetical protein [Empedobacter tilapiae]TGN24315.1 hypothetical protein E4J94_13815 [Empedobacter tilapiae]
MKLALLLSSIFLLFNGCLSFKEVDSQKNNLDVTNIKKLNGNYQIIQINNDSIYKKQRVYSNLFQQLDRKLIKDTLHIDSLKTYSLKIDILSKKKMKLLYLENGTLFRERVIKTKLKKDGFLYLKNKNFQPLLIPYIAGAIDINKIRFGLDTNNNLILDVANHTSGAILLIAFLDGRTNKYRLTYERID